MHMPSKIGGITEICVITAFRISTFIYRDMYVIKNMRP